MRDSECMEWTLQLVGYCSIAGGHIIFASSAWIDNEPWKQITPRNATHLDIVIEYPPGAAAASRQRVAKSTSVRLSIHRLLDHLHLPVRWRSIEGHARFATHRNGEPEKKVPKNWSLERRATSPIPPTTARSLKGAVWCEEILVLEVEGKSGCRERQRKEKDKERIPNCVVHLYSDSEDCRTKWTIKQCYYDTFWGSTFTVEVMAMAKRMCYKRNNSKYL